jgi:hypothetical protein
MAHKVSSFSSFRRKKLEIVVKFSVCLYKKKPAFMLHSVQTGSVARKASYPVGTRGKAAGDVKPATSNVPYV